jgi:membrane-associated protease RseP (regulator of RpoE activity)
MFDLEDTPLERSSGQIEDAVSDLLAVQDVTRGVPEHRDGIRLRGHLQVPSERAYPKIAARLRALGYTAMLRHDEETGLDELLALPGTMPEYDRPRLWVHVLLFGLTVLTTLYVGAGMSEARPADDLWWPLFHFWTGWPFALSLLSILLAHELGHYFMSRHHRVAASLPYFVPLPIPDFLGNVLGTMGAVIRMKAPITNRRVMLDIGSAGPLSGLVVAVPVLLLGLSMSQIQPLPLNQAYSMEGNSLLYLLLKYAVFGRWLPAGGVDVFIHPVAFAGWAGLLVTSLNLIPAGQLDGGHVLYSLVGTRAQRLTWPIILVLLGLGLVVWPGWLLWAGLVFLFGQGHPGPLDRITRLDARRKVLAVVVLLVLVLTFTPVPLTFVFPEGIPEAEGTALRELPLLAAGLVFAWGVARRLARRRRDA